jgi:translation initiation factor IF-3
VEQRVPPADRQPCLKGGPGIPPPPGDRSSDRGNRINEQIRISPVRLIGPEGEQFGVVPTSQALEKARDLGLDLVEVAPTERPPVCKIMDYGKFRYEKSTKEAKSNKQPQQKRKEIRLSPMTGDHDIETKLGHARKFLEQHNKVFIRVRFRGRELQHIDEGRRVMSHMIEKLADISKIEQSARMEGKQMTALLAPKV